jgi:4-diphosphocytidyl-2-C-methyl-D-erythritol kinase
VGLSTAAVFGRVRVPAAPESGEAIRRAVAAGAAGRIGPKLHNRLEEAAQELCPAVAALKRRVAGLGPAGQLMSGSGTTVFALCRDRDEARHVAHELRRGPGEGTSPRVFLVQSCT